MYGSIEGFKTYVLDRSIDVPADSDDDDIRSALVVASDWIDGRFGGVWRGTGTYKTGGRAQAREWPRSGFIDAYGYALPSDTVPREVEAATYEAAVRQLRRPGSLSVDFTLAKSIKQASIDGAVSVTYAGASSATDAQLEITIVNQILADLINSPLNRSVGNSLSGSVVRI